MKQKFILWLSLMAVILSFALHSCVQDEIYSASDPASKEYENKSLWKEDEKYIKNVMKVYLEHENEIKKTNGLPYWDYATTVNSFDESFLMVPLVEGKKVVAVLQASRVGSKVYFHHTQYHEHIAFFQGIVFAKHKKAIYPEGEAGKITACTRRWISVWYPDDESNPDPDSGSGHWESWSVIVCKQVKDECYGIVLPNGECDTSGGGDGGGFEYPGGGGNPETPEKTPCEKTKSVLNRPNVQQGVNNVKAQALQTLSNINAGEIGFREKNDGTLVPADVNASHKVVYNDVTGSRGGYHNHTATGTHMFSPPDIADTLFGFAAAQSIQDGVGNAYFGMVAAEWCNTCPNNVQYIHYVINYTGTGTELGGYVYTPVQMNQFIFDYQKIVDELSDTNINGTTYIKNNAGDLNEKGLEKLFIETLKIMNLSGKVNLQRVANGIVYNVTEDSNGMPVGTPCP